MVGASPCASCKLLRRRCAKDCIFAPYFPPHDPHKFAIVHKEIPVEQRGDAVSSLVFEANARLRDPVYGCVGAISYLQTQVSQLQMQLAVAEAEILCLQMQQQQQQQSQQPNIPITAQQMMMIPDDKSLHLSTNNFDYSLQQQYLNFGPTSNIVMQDPPKRESLWT
uniref:LOB domain-containing protein n=1 Tax=Daucus carota subsp. sativus TaxID=79200 RepID=A0A162A428_DAUCS